MAGKTITKKNHNQWPWPLLFLLITALLLIVGWGRISWIFSGDVWEQLLSDAFPQYFHRPYVLAVKKPAPDLAKNKSVKPIEIVNTSNVNATTTEAIKKIVRRDRLTIPKLGLSVPIITSATSDNNIIHGLLDSGVVLYPGSMPFGQVGTTVILGHSAPTGWPKIKYDWVFSRINELKKSDMVVVTYNNETRYYSVVKTKYVTPQAGVPEPSVSGNSLMLVSCWPPGKDLKRIAVEATIVNN